MPVSSRKVRLSITAAALVIIGIGDSALAVPYASGVRNTSGQVWEFVLNEDADSFTVLRDGGNPIVQNNPTAGRYSFDLSGMSTFSIEVNKSAAPGLTEISQESNLFTKFFRPSGLAISTDPGSPYFGTVYVANGNPLTTGGTFARPTGDGIYSLTADLQGVDLSTGISNWTVPSPTDTTQAKQGAGWNLGASAIGSGTNSPFRISLDASGNVIVGDWSDANGGIKYIGADLTGGGLVLEGQNGEQYGYLDPAAPLDGSVSPFVHGSIRGVPNVTGTVGVDLVVRALDEDLNRDPIGLITSPPNPLPTDGNHIWRWDLGAATNSPVKPTLLIDVGAGPGQLGTDSAGRPYQLALNIGVRADAEFFPQLGDNGLWILTSPRFNGDESGIVIVEVDETGATPPEVLWSSRQFTIDNGLDGFPNDPSDFGQDPNSDVFRNTGSVDVSADGSVLYVHRWLTDNPDLVVQGVPSPDVNPYLGRDSEYPGAILAIPLGPNGLPNIQIDTKGTSDPLDDSFTNLQSISYLGQASQNDNHEIEVDAAGNIYITDNSVERLIVFSPGGETRTTFSFDGANFSFTVGGGPTLLVGDYNEDGFVDAADYTVWRDNLGTSNPLANDPTGGVIGSAQYDAWKTAFANPGVAGGLAAAGVPEPGSLVLLGACSFGLLARIRRQKK